MRYLLALLLLFSTARIAEAQRPKALRGTRESLMEQNRIAREESLSVMKDSKQIINMGSLGLLVLIGQNRLGYYLDPNIGIRTKTPQVFRFARPWVQSFLDLEGQRFDSAFPGSSLKVTSLVRTPSFQKFLKRRNVNAARCDIPLTCSPHLTGSALDISKKTLTWLQTVFVRNQLILLQNCGMIIAIEEKKTNAFHIFVKPSFGKVSC